MTIKLQNGKTNEGALYTERASINTVVPAGLVETHLILARRSNTTFIELRR